MRLKLICTIVVFLFLMPLAAKGNEEKVGKKDEAVKKPIGVDIKHAPGPKVSEIPEAYNDLVKSFLDYWNDIKKGEYKKAYDLESSEYRKSTSFDLYNERHKKSALIIAVRPLGVKPINEKEVVVRASIGYKVAAIDTVRLFQDHWVKEGRAWRHLPKEEN